MMVRELDSRPPIDETAKSKGHVEVCGASSCDLGGNHTLRPWSTPRVRLKVGEWAIAGWARTKSEQWRQAS